MDKLTNENIKKFIKLLQKYNLTVTEKYIQEMSTTQEKLGWLIQYRKIFRSEVECPAIEDLRNTKEFIVGYQGDIISLITEIKLVLNHDENKFSNFELTSEVVEFIFGDLIKSIASDSKIKKYEFGKCKDLLDALIESYWKREELVRLALETPTNINRSTKKERIRIISESFLKKLLTGEFTTDKEVIKALNEIEPAYKPAVEEELKLLNPDGTPYQKRICISLSKIFEIKYQGETTNWTWVRKIYRNMQEDISRK